MRSRINIPHDMFDEILCRLAVKDVLRFRCLSKGCRDLIDSPDFVKLHLSHSLKTNSHRFLIIRNYGNPKPYTLDFDSLENAQIKNTDILPDLQVDSPILGSCNGLIALHSKNGDAIVICNPTTRKTREIPKPPTTGNMYVNYGFGYDPVSDDYKLVMLIQRYNKQNQRYDSSTKIYSFKSECWRNSSHETPCFPTLLLTGVKQTLVNNALHWIIKRDRSKTIVAFDLTTERYRDFPLPLLDHNTSSDVRFYFDMNLKELGGFLSMIDCRRPHDYSRGCTLYDVWVMKEYGVPESWTQLFSSTTMSGGISLFPLAYSKCAQKVLLVWINYDHYKHKLVWYNLKGETIEDTESLYVPFYKGNIDVCFGSLVSPTAAGTNRRPKRKASE